MKTALLIALAVLTCVAINLQQENMRMVERLRVADSIIACYEDAPVKGVRTDILRKGWDK